MIGTTVGSYRITAKVSVGGMGTVYKAEHALIGKQAAVKILHPELRGNREVVQRFFNEAKATTQIKHPGIVEVFDFGYMPSGDGFIVMEFLQGVSLARRLRKHNKMHEGEASVLMRSVCSALAAAHAMGIVHRDLKPDNIFLCPDPEAPTGERPKILDFGIAKLNVGLTGPGNATKTGSVMGTPTYMSPEQCRGTGEVDHRADLYSIGCMFYEMVAGRPPFDNMGAGELLGAHLFVAPPPPTTVGAEISPQCEQLIMALLEKSPVQRQPQTAVELGRLFGELAQGFGLVSRTTSLQQVDYGPRPDDGELDEELPPDDPDTSNPPIGTSNPHPSTPQGIAVTFPSTPGMNASALPSMAPKHSPEKTVAPTTLSGAASQSVLRHKSSKVGLVVGTLVALGVAGGAVFFTMKDSNNNKASVQPAQAPVADPVPVADPAPAPGPAPVPAPTPAPAPAPAPVATPVAPATDVAIPATDVAAPAPAAKDEPSTAGHIEKPTPKKPKKPAVTAKPATTPTKPPTTTPTKPADKPKPSLIETDI